MENICRINAVLEALKASPRRVNKVLIQRDAGHHRIGEVIRRAREHHIPLSFVPKRKLDLLAPNHQGLLAFLSARDFSSLEDILAASRTPFLVLLDEVEDPQNLGAIIRSAEGAGADGIILPERRSAGLTEAVFSVSAGAAEHLKIARVVNLAQTLEELKSRGLWLVGAEGGGQEMWYEFDYTQPVGLVLGSESKGLRPLVRKRCDKILSIPLLGRVNSLNVAAAAAVFLFEVVRQRTAFHRE